MGTKIAVVTGSNKGIGFAIVKGLCQRFDGLVYLTSRDKTRGEQAVEKLKKEGLNPLFHQLDVADRKSVIHFKEHIAKTHGSIDILINNAGVVASDDAEVGYVVDINYKSILTIQQILFPLLRQNARVINVSSDCGHLSNLRNKYWIERLSTKDLKAEDVNEFVEWYLESKRNGTFKKEDFADNATFAEYRVSKIALSALSFIQQRELESRGIIVNSMHPGLVQTDMTREVGFYTPEQSAETPLYLALEAPESLRGAYVWFDKTVLDWYDYNADYYFKSSTLMPTA